MIRIFVEIALNNESSKKKKERKSKISTDFFSPTNKQLLET